MFVRSFDLRTILFILLLLPLAGALFTLLVVRLRARRQRSVTLSRQLEQLMASAPCGLLIFDANQKLLSVNDMARRLLQMPPSSTTLPDAEAGAGWVERLQTDLSEGNRYRTLDVPYTPNGANAADENGESGGDPEKRVVRWWISRAESLFLVLLFDMTNEEQAAQSANRLLSDLSHELRTPLATLLTHLEVVSLPEIGEDARSQSIHFMKDETERLVRLSNQTLALGRLQSGRSVEPAQVNMRELVESAVSQMQVEAAAKDGRILIEADELVPAVWGDPDQLRQVLLNLIENALKYGGDQVRIVVSLAQVDEGVGCTVRDNGSGIPAEHLGNLERRYYRASPQSAPGSGLGLAMVREILRRHNTQLEISSQVGGPDCGTTMSFTLASAVEEDAGT